MQRLSPGPEHLLARTHEIFDLLDADVFEEPTSPDGTEKTNEEQDEEQRGAQRHAFLLRLGVWEVPPIEAYVNWGRQNRGHFPWSGEITDKQREAVERNGGWKFGYGWTDKSHQDVYIAEDFRFVWSLEEMAKRSMPALVTGLRLGERLYSQSSVALVFCPYCRDGGRSHTAWRQSGIDDGFPSSLAIQLSNAKWVPCTLDGELLGRPTIPRFAWWHRKPPTDAALRQSPWRLVPLCSPDKGMTEELRRLAGVHTMEDAGVDAVKVLLLRLREQFRNEELPIDPTTSGSARQALVGLHRLAYERLSELSSAQSRDVAAVLKEVEVLCELGESLVYRKPDEAWHDDGRFATYARHFVDHVPFAVVPRDRMSVAERLGILKFRLKLNRRGEDEGQDVTEDVRDIHSDRIAELLAIVVHHSLGAQTLDETGEPFEVRARRLRNLRIKQLEDLVVDVVVEGHEARVTLGEGSRQDLFLENPTSSSPVLFHDLSGGNWQDRLRHKIAPYLATIIENQAYAHTFALFLQKENEAEREEFLLELGISGTEVDAISARIGVVREEERRLHLRWYSAILAARSAGSPTLDLEDLVTKLRITGLPVTVADRLVALGGGEEVRRETGENSALRLLSEAGTDIRALHKHLCEAGDAALDIRDARNTFFRWLDTNRRRLAAVLATKLPQDVAKRKARSPEPP